MAPKSLSCSYEPCLQSWVLENSSDPVSNPQCLLVLVLMGISFMLTSHFAPFQHKLSILNTTDILDKAILCYRGGRGMWAGYPVHCSMEQHLWSLPTTCPQSPLSWQSKMSPALTSVASRLDIVPQRKRSPVRFPVRAHAWVAYKRQPMDVSLPLSPSLLLSVKMNKILKKKRLQTASNVR